MKSGATTTEWIPLLGDEGVEVVGVGEPVVGQVVAGHDRPAVGDREAVDPAVAGIAARPVGPGRFEVAVARDVGEADRSKFRAR